MRFFNAPCISQPTLQLRLVTFNNKVYLLFRYDSSVAFRLWTA